MARTLVGYAGGASEHPTYHKLGMHTESVHIEYDPGKMMYDDLLAIFWESHRPVTPSYAPQYASIIFYHTPEQKRLAEASKAAEEARLGQKLHTDIRPATAFWPAEDYHQKYYLRRFKGIMAELLDRYHGDDAFARSTVAARLNAFAAGMGKAADLQALLPDLALSDVAANSLVKEVKARF